MEPLQRMYASSVDNGRLIEVFFRHEFERGLEEKTFKNQATLAQLSSVPQATVSLVSNVSHSFLSPDWLKFVKSQYIYSGVVLDQPSRPVLRNHLLHVFGKGLGVEQGLMDVVLWLFDGIPLQKSEYGYITHPGGVKATTYTSRTLVNQALTYLRQAAEFFPINPTQDSYLYFDSERFTKLGWYQSMVEYEQQEGEMRYLSTILPPYLAAPDDLKRIEENAISRPIDHDPALKKDIQELLRLLAVFHQEGIRQGYAGCRCMMPRYALSSLFTTNNELHRQVRANAVRKAIHYLQHPDQYRFEFLITDDFTPHTQLYLKSTRRVMAGSPHASTPLQQALHGADPVAVERPAGHTWLGPAFTEWRDRGVVGRFYSEFEHAWFQTLSHYGKAKDSLETLQLNARQQTIRFLKEVLEDAGLPLNT